MDELEIQQQIVVLWDDNDGGYEHQWVPCAELPHWWRQGWQLCQYDSRRPDYCVVRRQR